ncbi:tetratricopeptide repeat protein [Solimonas marina]|uniref:Tetratricopeptide repeat protein n=1 Tax=Solimonas marina TaxID=2714601 RepID=A0A970BAJ5_9GAMM|nr:tetratricopeptide repeat protein [Solimonas marina]NKF23436.1 tetratricopeptide repeat protein [Solimonas marina]
MMIDTTHCNSAARTTLATSVLAMVLAACSTVDGPSSGRPAPTAQAVPSVAVARSARDPQDDAQARFDGALKLMNDGRYAEAETALQLLGEDFPQYSGPLTNLGILYVKQKKRSAAVDAFRRAIKAKPNNAIALNWLGVLSREQGRYRDAERYYQLAARARSDYAAPHLNLAILYDESLHRPQDAVDEYRAYQKIAGDQDQPMVEVWVHQIEDHLPSPSRSMTASATEQVIQ